jgi:hypothetical protein
MHYRSGLSIKDLKNILLWHDRAFKEKNDVGNLDIKTMIKIQAMIIYEEEEDEPRDKFERF